MGFEVQIMVLPLRCLDMDIYALNLKVLNCYA